tara:strand:- start:5756 stop:7045 length:1290 start_codon:yes stop_codon:yes gene_type:complete
MNIVCALRKIKGAISKEDGLSLIEAAIGLVVISLIALPMIQAQTQQIADKIYKGNYGTLANAEQGINQFFGSGAGVYPCPASLTLAEGDTGFGVSGDCTLTNVRLCTDAAWPASEGICKTDNTPDAIIIGGVPFATLQMPQDESLDYWGNKVFYAVTQKQTDPATYATNAGEIRILAADSALQVAAGTADGVPDQLGSFYDMILFSTGSNGVGGYSKDGVAIGVCGNATTGFESENCDLDNVFFVDKNPNADDGAIRSDVAGVNYYDDWTRAQETPPISTWFQHNSPTNFVLTLATKVGIGTTDPSDSLEVMGAIRVEPTASFTGRLKSDSICNESNCFDPDIITHTSLDMSCESSAEFPYKRAVTEIRDSSTKCSTGLVPNPGSGPAYIPYGDGNNVSVDATKFNAFTCGGGQVAAGFVNGDLVCVNR